MSEVGRIKSVSHTVGPKAVVLGEAISCDTAISFFSTSSVIPLLLDLGVVAGRKKGRKKKRRRMEKRTNPMFLISKQSSLGPSHLASLLECTKQGPCSK